MKLSFIILIITMVLGACSYKVEELKYDPRGKVITFNIGKQDTIFFEENSSQIDSIYSVSLKNMSEFVKLNSYKVFLRANTHEEEMITITQERIAEVEKYFFNLGLKREQVLINNKINIIPVSEDDILTDEEKKPARRVIIQIMN